MIRLPQRGIARSVRRHNSEFAVFCDWVELSALTGASEISRSDAVDHLVEAHIYDDQDFCSERVTSAWSELRRRQLWLGSGSDIQFTSARIATATPWQAMAAHTFCVTVSLAPHYKGWFDKFGADYTAQGALFERLAMEALPHRFSGWVFQSTGWSAQTAVELIAVVPELAAALGEDPGDIQKYATGKAHEAGLDLAWYLPFPDVRGGLPAYLAQCASGANWISKLHTPALPLWNKLIDFTHPPSKALVLPFALDDSVFRNHAVLVEGLIIDRYRLLPPQPSDAWLSENLARDLIAWLEPRIGWLESPGSG